MSPIAARIAPRHAGLTAAAALLVTSILGAACTSSGGSGAPDAGAIVPDAAPGALLVAPPTDQGFQVSMHTTVAAGAEVFRCQYKVVPAGHSLDFGKFEIRYSANSHHAVMYTTSLTPADAAAEPDVFDCHTKDLRIVGSAFGSQAAARDLAYPTGIAFHMDTKVVLLQAHDINTTDSAVDADLYINSWYATGAITEHAGTFGFYDYSIQIPPTTDTAHPGTATVHMRCKLPADLQVLSFQSHAHKRMTNYHSELSGGGLASPMTIYDTTVWEGPDPIEHDPPMALKAGQFLDYYCTYQNDRATTTSQGQSAIDNEMCMLIGTYYPQQDLGFDLCMGNGSGPVYAGTKTCGETATCMAGAATDADQQVCMMATCAGDANLKLNDFVSCVFLNGCSGDTNCTLSKCSAELSACQATTCP